jgi:hypothetical protein
MSFSSASMHLVVLSLGMVGCPTNALSKEGDSSHG